MEKYTKKLLLFFLINTLLSSIYAPKPPDLFGATRFLDNTDYNLTFQDLDNAVSLNNAELVRDIVASGVNPNQLCANNLSPLHCAVIQNNSLMLKYLLELEARPNITDLNGQTPLHLAVQQNNTEIVKFLLADPRTNVRQFDNFGQQPLLYATNRAIRQLIQDHIEKDLDIFNMDIN